MGFKVYLHICHIICVFCKNHVRHIYSWFLTSYCIFFIIRAFCSRFFAGISQTHPHTHPLIVDSFLISTSKKRSKIEVFTKKYPLELGLVEEIDFTKLRLRNIVARVGKYQFGPKGRFKLFSIVFFVNKTKLKNSMFLYCRNQFLRILTVFDDLDSFFHYMHFCNHWALAHDF